MPKYFLLGFFLFAITFAKAQNTGVIKGRVIDSVSNKPVEMATVVVSDARDTTASFISYTLTDNNGKFTLHKLPAAIPLKVLITYVAYQPTRRRLNLRNNQTADLGNILFSPKELAEIVIKGERVPVVFKKDTIEFNAEAFKTRPNAMVEELLKKLPGVEVDNTGAITVLGKEVTKVQVDGKDFFTNDIRIATRNLDADMISTVQVYDDRENDPNHVIPDKNVKKIINLKFKKAFKKSIFGKVYGGKGTNGQYQAGGLVNMFRDTLQVSLLGAQNNLNNTGFDFNDLSSLGGALRGGGDALFSAGFSGGAPNGRQTTRSGGVNINTDYGKKLKINLAYTFNSTDNSTQTFTNRQQFLNDTTFVTRSINSNISNNSTQYFSGTVTWRPGGSATTYFRYSPYLTISNNSSNSNNSSTSYSNFVPLINNSLSATSSNGNSTQFRHSLSFNKQLKKKGAAISFDHNLSISPGSSYNIDDQSLTSYVAGLQSFAFSRKGDNTNTSKNINLSGTLVYPLGKKITVDIRPSAQLTDNLNRVETYDYNAATGNYDLFLPIQSSDLNRRIFNGSFNGGGIYNITNGITLSAHLLLQSMKVNDRFGRGTADLNRSYFNALPTISLSYKSFNLNYSQNMNLPNIGDMIPYSVVFSPLSSVTGNPDLKPTIRSNFGASYNKYNFQKGINLFVNLNFSYEENSIFRQRTLSKELVETSTPINRNGRYNYSLSTNFNKRFKKTNDLEFSASSNGGLSYNRDFFVINRQNGYQNGYTLNLSQSFNLNWKNIVTLSPQYSLAGTFINFNGLESKPQNYIIHSAATRVGVAWPKRFYIDGTYNYRYNPLAPAGFQKSSNLLNLSVARQFLKKDKGEIKLSCYDILNQNINIFRFISANTITDTEQQTIKRYFMLTLLFKFNKSTSK